MKRYSTPILIAVTLLLVLLATFSVNRITRAEKGSQNLTASSKRKTGNLRSLAQTPTQVNETQPIWGEPANFAISDPVRDLPPALVTDRGESGPQEINEQNRYETKIATESNAKKSSIDGALQAAKPIESDTPSVPSLTF